MLRGIGLSTLLGVGTQLTSGGNQADLVRALRESSQQNVDCAGQRIVERNLDIQPTIRVRLGFPLRVLVHKDLGLRPWGRTMTGLQLARLPDRTPVRITVAVAPDLNLALADDGELYRETYGQAEESRS